MRIAVFGAGAIGPAWAVLARQRGHEAALWSPSGAGLAGYAGTLHAEGAVAASVPVAAAPDPATALDGADAAVLAVPVHAHRAVMERLAPVLPAGLPVLVGPALSLSASYLHSLTGGPVIALATTPMTGRRLAPDRVRIGAIRAGVDAVALGMEADAAAGLIAALTGVPATMHADPLLPALANVNPPFHAALALTNVTRIERGEAWPQYEMMTPAVCRLIAALDEERLALAAHHGLSVTSAAAHLARTNGIAEGSLPAMCAAIVAARAPVLGPTAMDSRYVTEDVAFGLCFWQVLARRAGVAMPAMDATVAALDVLWGRSFAAANDLLPVLAFP